MMRRVVTLSLRPETDDKLKAYAERLKLSKSRVVQIMLEVMLEKVKEIDENGKD